MKIYVDEMPNNCKECGFCCRGDLCYWCQGIGDGGFYIPDETLKEKRLSGCPLLTTQSLKQQVRVKWVEEIKKRLAEQRTKMQNDTHCYPQTVVCWQDIVAILDQVKGESNVKD